MGEAEVRLEHPGQRGRNSFRLTLWDRDTETRDRAWGGATREPGAGLGVPQRLQGRACVCPCACVCTLGRVCSCV